jgi:ankyrin repeat protein
MHALYRGRPAIAEMIAAALPGLDVFEAAALGRTERLEAILAHNPAEALRLSPDGFTALHYPAFFGLGDAVGATRALLATAADVNARSRNAFSVLPLHSAVAGNHDEVVAVLLAAGADVNTPQRHRFTPLHGAAQNGAAVTVERLLAAGADPMATNDDGSTAADLAAAAGHEELAERLR